MNSSQLKKDYPEVYRKFFNEYDLVLSVPLIFELTGLLGRYVDSDFLSVKTPLRYYIGISRKAWDKKIPYTFMENQNSWFSETDIDKHYNGFKEIINKEWKNIKVWFLCEYNRKDPIPMIGTFLLGEKIIRGELGINDIHHLETNNKDGENLLNQITSDIDKISDMYGEYILVKETKRPYLYNSSLSSQTPLSHFCDNKTNKYLNEKHFKILPFHIYILHPNSVAKSNYISNLLFDQNNEIKEFAKSNNYKYDNNLLDALYQLEKYSSLEIIKNIDNLIKLKISWKDFFKNLEFYRSIYSNLFKTDYKNDIYRGIKSFIEKDLHVNNSFSILWWWARYIIFSETPLQIDNNSIQTLNKELNTQFTLDYASPVDGFDTEGIKVEQYISDGIYSPFCSPYRTIIFQNTEITHGHGEYKEIIENWKDGLLLNEVDNKIYLFGKKLTSQEIHSQSATIELLHHLMQYPWQEISNKELTPSAYSKNKNDMVGKIITPLQKYIAKHSTHKIDIHCKGSLNAFTITLENTSLPVMLLYPANNIK